MSTALGTVERVLVEVAGVLDLLADGLDEERVQTTLIAVGIDDPAPLLARQTFVNARDAVVDAVEQMAELVASLSGEGAKDPAEIIALGLSTADAIGDVITALNTLAGELRGFQVGLPPTDQIVRSLFDILLINQLASAPLVVEALTLLGVVTWTQREVDDLFVDVPSVSWSGFRDLLLSPLEHLRTVFDQGRGSARGILDAIVAASRRSMVPALFSEDDPERLEAFFVSLWPAGSDGLEFEIALPLECSEQLPIRILQEGWTAEVRAEAAIESGTGGTWQWGAAPRFSGETAEEFEPTGSAELILRRGPGVLLSIPGGPQLEASALDFTLGLFVEKVDGGPVLATRASAQVSGLVAKVAATDSLLASLFGAVEVGPAGLGLTWTVSEGLRIAGQPGLRLELPLGITLGPVQVLGLALEVGSSDGTLSLSAAADLSTQLGPFALAIDGLGLEAVVGEDVQNGVALSVGQIHLAAKPPTGAGISIDLAEVVSGGGFLDIVPEKGEYSGVFEAELLNVGITVVGVILTQLPGDPDGWSMFLSLSAEFTALQLGFGFTLNGVGGLVGVNRSLDEDALADGVRSGALDSILFPEDPVANAPRILADMAAVFPPAEGQFVFGPVVKLGWGTPTLVEADLGVILQLPDPLTVSLLGSLETVLPEEDAPIVELRVDVAGTVNLTEGTLKVDASLRDSQVAGLALSGDLAIRAAFVDNPSFLFSFGGFHPAFAPPQGFPTLARLGMGLDTGDELRITLGSYFAVSSSTLQFGASCELWAKAVGFTAEGGTSFDALIIFKPFGFIISLKAWVSISAGEEELLGVLLAGELQGPNRWHVAGLATFKLLGVKKCLEVDVRFGRAEDEEPREVIDVEDLLIEALRDPDAWSVVPVAVSAPGVVLAESDAETLRVHPAGAIEVRQRIVPLKRRIDCYGNATLSGPDEFALTDARMGSRQVNGTDVEDWFAAAQYWEMKDAERLSAPSFELMPAGVRLEGGGMTAGDARRFTADYEVKVRDPAVRGERVEESGKVVPARALKRRSRRRTRRPRALGGVLSGRRGARQGPQVAEVTFVDMNIRTGRAERAAARGDRFYVARERIARSADPRSLAVVPGYELETE